MLPLTCKGEDDDGSGNDDVEEMMNVAVVLTKMKMGVFSVAKSDGSATGEVEVMMMKRVKKVT